MAGSDSRLRTALDSLPFGEENAVAGRVTKELPQGVTSGMLYRDVVRIAWPSFVELMLTQLASMVDLMMVGSLGAWALTAVGLTTQPKFLLMTVFQSMNVGATALVARYKGADNPQKANLVVRQAVLLTLVLSVIASVLGYIFAEPMIRFMGATDAQSLEGGTVYLQIQMLGFVFMALTTTVTAVLRGVGDSRTAMIYNLVANLVNVVFNYLLIYGRLGFPRMGVAGASLATIIGQFVAFLAALVCILRGRGYLRLEFREGFKPDREMLGNIFNIGLPAMIEQLLMRAGMIIYAKTVATLGTVPFATHQVCMNIQALSFMNGQAFAVSATTLMGQSLGRRRPDMAQAYCSRTRRVGMFIAVAIGLSFIFLGRQMVSLYNSDPQIVELGGRVLLLVAVMQPLQSSQFIIAGALRGAGDTRATAVITFITVLIVRPVSAIILVQGLHWGLEGAWIAMVLDQVLRSVLVLARYQGGKWKTIRLKNS
ncbi:MAG: MATE family efflux transporter [Oscillospiraceae bacterium]|jgi:putative MATE family efflux protein|nr:MATE family efflux transporter [Oscillospiraceae bacterium]